MPVDVARSVRLPPDLSTPPAARRFVRLALIEAGVAELVDDAVLLTTELVNNGVLHAGTDLEVELFADRDGVTITVVDSAPERPIAPRPQPSPTTLGGRGLLIVSRAATRWGTTHHADRKAVWFQLDRPGRTSAGADMHSSRAGADPYSTAVAELLRASTGAHMWEDAPGFGKVLLQTLARHVRLQYGAIRVDREDGTGLRTLARINTAEPSAEEALLLPLKLGHPWSGVLEISTMDNVVSRTLATLVAERMSSYLESQRLREINQSRKAWLAYLAEVDTMLGHSIDRALTTALIPRLVVPRLGEWAALHVAGKDGALTFATATHVDEGQVRGLASVLESAETLATLRRLPATDGATPITFDGWLDAYAIPLTARNQPVGVLTAGVRASRQSPEDLLMMMEEIARRASLALDNARIYAERQQIARVLQRSLLPPALPTIPGVDLAAEYAPTDEQIDVGGDFYDAVPMTDGRWLLVVGDVSGKGVEAAVVTGLVRDVIRALVVDGRPIPHILSVLNQTLAARAGGLYCTLVLALLERGLDGELRVRLHLAGHDRAVLVRSGQPVSFVGSTGTALGLLDVVHSPAADIRLAADDALVLYTDGVTERRNGRELFGLERLREALQPLAGYPASVVAAQLKAVTMAFSASPPHDDIAILVVRNVRS